MSLNNTPNNLVALAGVGTGTGGRDILAQLAPLCNIPLELLHDIMSNLDRAEINQLRSTCYQLDFQIWSDMRRKLTVGRTLYATVANLANFLGMLNTFAMRGVGGEIEELCLVADGVKAHEFGYGWAWENLLQVELREVDAKGESLPDKLPTEHDMQIINDANVRHMNFAIINNGFVNSGGYRAMLTAILNACPNLNVLNIRKLKADEHLPGWFETEKLEKLSFYKPGMNTKDIFYGDWQYDTVHGRVTHYTDEYTGEAIVEPNAGPQASFIDDLNAAINASGRANVITTNFIRG